ncbi:MAG: D-alanine--D-alanine ligase [Dissulfuribacterales bacterium]
MNSVKKIRLALLCGGKSSEREVSLSGAKGVLDALNRNKYDVEVFDTATDLPRLMERTKSLDVAFILLHGRFGEDGTVQGLLELLSIPYQGSGVLGSALAMNKHFSKVMYRDAGIPTPDWLVYTDADEYRIEEIPERLGLPVMIKPANQGSSIGMAKVERMEDMLSAIREASKWDEQVVLERFVRGRELTAGVLGLKELTALPIVEIRPNPSYSFFDYEAKYQKGATEELCPAPIPEKIAKRAQDLAVRAHRALGLRGYSRTDMILTETEELFVLETNTIPGMTPTSLLPQAAQAMGIGFSELLDKLIAMALDAHKPDR